MSSTSFHPPFRLLIVTAILLGFTGFAAWLSQTNLPLPVPLGIIALSLAWIKGALVAEQFMELRHAPWLLRGMMHAWLAVICVSLILSLTI